ncbi:MAG: RidA family protein [Promethearchaeota archaeon]
MVEKEVVRGRPPFSDAIKVGNTIYISGQIPKDPIEGGWAESTRGQTTQCLKNIKSILEKVGADVKSIVQMTIFLTNIADYGEMNEAFIEFFKNNGIKRDFPARSAVQVGPLMYREWYIEIDAIAVL